MDFKVVGEMANLLGDSPARFVSQLYILLGTRDGFKRRRNCEAAGRAEAAVLTGMGARTGFWISFKLKSQIV